MWYTGFSLGWKCFARIGLLIAGNVKSKGFGNMVFLRKSAWCIIVILIGIVFMILLPILGTILGLSYGAFAGFREGVSSVWNEWFVERWNY